MRIRFYNARILTMEDDRSLLENAELWVEDSKISYVGAAVPNPCSLQFDREIDTRGNLLMPGFKNAHTHSGMTFLRSYADDLPLLDWLHQQVFPMEAKLTPDDVYHLSRLAIMEYLTSGITANFDMYLFPDEIVRASIDTGFRTVLCSGMNDYSTMPPVVRDDYLRLNGKHDRISYLLGFHAEYTTSNNLLEYMAGLAHEFHAPVYTHNSESRAEVEGCLERNKATPTAYLNSFGMFDYGGGGFHCVHMTDADLDLCAEKGISVVTNPASNAKLASGIARLTDMTARGINLAIGTDGPASNNCLDMFREMFLATSLQKLRLDDASAMDAYSVLHAATVGGARAMHLDNCDVLAAGKCADLIMLDLHQPNMQPLNNLQKNIVYSGSKQNVMLTMVAGQILYENRQFHIGVDPEEAYAKANEIINSKR